MSHFDALGFPASDAGELEPLLTQAFDLGREQGGLVEHAVGSTARYVDPSGATLTIHVNRQLGFECCQPSFESGARFRWRPLEIFPDADGCRFCDTVEAEFLDDDDEMEYQFALTLESMEEARERLPLGEAGDVTFAALCEQGEVWEDEAAFERAHEADWPRFASRSLVPSGLFGDDESADVTSHVFAHGIVASVEERRNELGGATFTVVGFDTLGGVVDVCLAPATLEREELVAPGAVVGAVLWLVGRPLTLREPAERPPGGLRGLLRRLS